MESTDFNSSEVNTHVLEIEIQKQIAEKFYETDAVRAIFELTDHSQYTREHADTFWNLTVVITQTFTGVDVTIKAANDEEIRIGDIILDESDETKVTLKEPEFRQQNFDAQDETSGELIPLGRNTCANTVYHWFDLCTNASAWLNFSKSKSIDKGDIEFLIEEYQTICIEHDLPNYARESYFLHRRNCSIEIFLDTWRRLGDHKFTTKFCCSWVSDSISDESKKVYHHLRQTLCETSKTKLNVIERSIYDDVMADEADEIEEDDTKDDDTKDEEETSRLPLLNAEDDTKKDGGIKTEEETSCLSFKTQARIGNVISFFITSIFVAYPIVWKFAFSFIVPHFNNIICLSSFWGAYALVGAFALLVSITRIFKNFPLHIKAAKYVRGNSKNENGLDKFKCFLARTFSTRDVANEHEHVEESL
jgi:hypothetical protein